MTVGHWQDLSVLRTQGEADKTSASAATSPEAASQVEKGDADVEPRAEVPQAGAISTTGKKQSGSEGKNQTPAGTEGSEQAVHKPFCAGHLRFACWTATKSLMKKALRQTEL